MTLPTDMTPRALNGAARLAQRIRSRAPLLCALALLQGYAAGAQADNGKVDSWCNVIEQNIQRNEDDARRAHDSASTDRLRDARRKLEKDAHDRNCPGH